MSTKALALFIKILVTLIVVLTGAVGWYYTFGRKPKLTLSTKFVEKDGAPSAHLLAPGEVLLLVGAKATLYELASGQQRWTASRWIAPTGARPRKSRSPANSSARSAGKAASTFSSPATRARGV